MKTQNIAILIILLSSWFTTCGQTHPTSIDEANRLYFHMKPSLAYAQYERIWLDSSFSKKDKSTAARKMASTSWILYKDAAKAYKILTELENFNFEKSGCYLVWSRILTEDENFDMAIVKARQALAAQESTSQLYSSQIRFVKSVLEKYKKIIFEGLEKSNYIERDEFLEALTTIQSIVVDSPGDVLASKLHLGMSLIAAKRAQAYEGWLSFYRADEEGNVHPTLKTAQEKLISGLKSETDFDGEKAEQIIIGLAESGFFEYAALMIKLHERSFSFKNSLIDDIWSYYTSLQKIDALTIAFYRSEVVNKGDEKEYRSAIKKESELLWDKLNWSSGKPKFTETLFEEEMRKRFGMVAKLMNANGHFGLSLGHIVLEEDRLITQYSKQGNLRYIAIDHMVSNGYSSWFWDGDAEIGGWAPDEKSILQVRSAYSSGPVSAWLSVTDSIKIRDTQSDIARNSKSDDVLAMKDPFSYLPGLNQRIGFNSTNKILSSLKSEGLANSELRTAFLNIYEKSKLESGIFAHEGRHAIDKKYEKNLGSEELEFRAKLSEIYFSEYPFLSLSAILSPNIGDGTSHGQANLRIIKGIIGWMKRNTDELEGYNPERPMLPQLDLLTGNQLKSAVRSFDPLAKGT